MDNSSDVLNSSWLNFIGDKSLRNRVFSREAVVVYSHELDEIVWANASGANLFGGATISEFLAAEFDEKHPFIRQLASAVRQLGKEKIYRGFRIVDGDKSRLLQCEIAYVNDDQDHSNIIVSCSNPHMEKLREDNFSQIVLDSFAPIGTTRAICDRFGLVIAASDAFVDAGIFPDTVEDACKLLEQGVDNNFSMKNDLDVALKVRIFDLNQEKDRYLVVVDDEPDMGEIPAEDTTNADTPIGQDVEVEQNPTELSENGVDDQDVEIETDEEEEDSDKFSKSNGIVGGVVAGIAATSAMLFGPNKEKAEEVSDLQNIVDDELQEDMVDDDEPIALKIDDMSEEQTPTKDELFAEDAAQSLQNDDAVEKEELTDATANDEFVFSSESESVRFRWVSDTNQVITFVSPELAEAVGPNAADLVGRKWSDIATVFGFDTNGEIHSLLQARDTWSGKSVLWPIQGTDLQAPIDLAALPSFSSGRNFEGFRGYGIVRLFDTIVDPEETGLALVEGPIAKSEENTIEEEELLSEVIPDEEIEENQQFSENRDDEPKDEPEDDQPDIDEPDIDEPENDQPANDQPANDQDEEELAPSNIVALSSRRNKNASSQNGEPNSQTSLTNGENKAFREIGQKLRDTTKFGVSHLHYLRDEGGDKDERNADLARKTPEQSGVDTSVLQRLPIPVLVYRENGVLFANSEFLSLLGFANHDEINDKGGFSTLFDDDCDEEIDDRSDIVLQDKDGSKLTVKALLQSVPWDEQRAYLLSFRQPRNDVLPEDEKVVLDMMRVSELQNILDTATDGIIVLDENGMVLSINQSGEALFGRGEASVCGQSVKELFANESHKIIDKHIADVLNPVGDNLLRQGCDVIGVEEKGGLIPLYITIGKIGSSDKLCAILRDMTPWKKAREELEAAKKQAENASDQKTEFLARVSHEIRTPLNAIIGFSDVMIDERFGPVDNDRYREYLRDINRSGIHVLDLINDLLDISKIEAGKMDLVFEAVDLNKLVGETVALLQPQANGSRVLIRTSLSRAVPKVVADARSIRQIVLNLVSNAIKFTDANGQVIVSTVYEGNGEVALRVRDTGRGMSEEEVEIAMKPFRQINSISETHGQGTGLGLPLTKALVEANKAFLDIESEPNEGTIVHIQFPTQRVLAD